MILGVVGTRPEVIKLAPVVHALRRRALPVELAVSGQHFDPAMMATFLADAALSPDYTLSYTSGDDLGSLSQILDALGALCRRRRPALVLAVGDTTTVLAAALAAR